MANNAYVNLIGFVLITWLSVVAVFDMKILRRIFYYVIAYSLILLFEFLFIPYHVIEDGVLPPLSDHLLWLIIIKFGTFIAYIIVIHISSKTKKSMPNHIFAMYLCLPAATLGMLVTVGYLGINVEGSVRYGMLVTIFAILMLLGNMLIYYAYNKYLEEVYANSNHEIIIMKQREELSHLQESIRKNEQHQEWIHDTGNYIKILKKLIDLGQNERAGHVLEELNKELEKNVMTDYSDNLVLNALLSEKAYMAESQAVTFDVYVEPNLNLESIRDMDIISMLGNLIDNAVRGAGECADKREVRVRIFMQNEGNILVIKIDNDCVENIQIHGNALQSTKKEEGVHGLGIKSVVHTAEKYDGYLEYSIQNGKFTSILLLPV